MIRDLQRTSAPPRGAAERRQASLGRSRAAQSSVRRLCTTFTDSAVTAMVSLRALKFPVQVGATSCSTSSTGSLYRCRKTASLTYVVCAKGVSMLNAYSCRLQSCGADIAAIKDHMCNILAGARKRPSTWRLQRGLAVHLRGWHLQLL